MRRMCNAKRVIGRGIGMASPAAPGLNEITAAVDI